MFLCLSVYSIYYLQIVGVDNVSLVIGFQDHVECDGQGSVMDMDAFAVMSGFIGLVLALSGVVAALFVCPTLSYPASSLENIKKNAVFTVCTAIGLIAISIIGSVNYSSVDGDCKNSPLGNVVLAWCIMRSIGGCCGCVHGAAVRYLNSFSADFNAAFDD